MLTDNFFRRVALDPLRSRIPTDYVAVRIEHEDRVVGHRIDEELKTAFGFCQLGGRRGKLSGPIGGTRLQSFIQRQQPRFQCLAFADVVVDPRYLSRATGPGSDDLSFSRDPMNAAVRMGDPKLDVIGAGRTGLLDRHMQLRQVINKDRRFPVGKSGSWGFRIETEQDGDMRRACPGVCFQVPLEPADPTSDLRDPKPFFGRLQPLLDAARFRSLFAHRVANARCR